MLRSFRNAACAIAVCVTFALCGCTTGPSAENGAWAVSEVQPIGTDLDPPRHANHAPPSTATGPAANWGGEFTKCPPLYEGQLSVDYTDPEDSTVGKYPISLQGLCKQNDYSPFALVKVQIMEIGVPVFPPCDLSEGIADYTLQKAVVLGHLLGESIPVGTEVVFVVKGANPTGAAASSPRLGPPLEYDIPAGALAYLWVRDMRNTWGKFMKQKFSGLDESWQIRTAFVVSGGELSVKSNASSGHDVPGGETAFLEWISLIEANAASVCPQYNPEIPDPVESWDQAPED